MFCLGFYNSQVINIVQKFSYLLTIIVWAQRYARYSVTILYCINLLFAIRETASERVLYINEMYHVNLYKSDVVYIVSAKDWCWNNNVGKHGVGLTIFKYI